MKLANPKKVMILNILTNFPYKEIAYMTESEFLHLEIGTVISDRFKENRYFIIDDIDQMGTAYKGRKYIV